MGLRFFKRIKIFPGVYLNFGKGGVSLSLGPRGMKTTIGKRGIKQSFGLPGTGIRYETKYIKPWAGMNRHWNSCEFPQNAGNISVCHAIGGDNVRKLNAFLNRS